MAESVVQFMTINQAKSKDTHLLSRPGKALSPTFLFYGSAKMLKGRNMNRGSVPSFITFNILDFDLFLLAKHPFLQIPTKAPDFCHEKHVQL